MTAVRSTPPEFSGDTVVLFESTDLLHWESRVLLRREGWRLFNTSLAKGDTGYMLCMETNYSPEDDIGEPFTCYFASSPDLHTWTPLPNETAYPKHRYCGGPCMKYHNGYFYLFLVPLLFTLHFSN